MVGPSDMENTVPPVFQVHWSLVPPEEAGGFTSSDCQLLAIWPAPANHDVCFENAGFDLFADNDDGWDRAAEELLRRVIENLSQLGALKLMSEPLRENPPWYLRPFRAGEELVLLEQALLPMQDDSLPMFHARFGDHGAALRTGSGHFLLWINLPDTGLNVSEFVRRTAEPWPVHETGLRWPALLPGQVSGGHASG